MAAGPGVTVDGNGSISNPYIISSDAATTPTPVTAGDTATVDTTVAGTGTVGDPYVVSAAVILDAAPPGGGSNLVHEGADGLYVECADVRGCLTAGDGIAYDPATGEIEARPSADAGNAVTFGSDGGLYSAGGGGSAPTVVEAADTPSVDTTVAGTGTAGDPYVVSAAVVLDPAPPGGGSNLVHEGADGLYVECADVRGCLTAGDGIAYDPATGEIEARPSTDAGNALAIGTDGGLYAPAGGGTPTALQAADTSTVDTTVSGTGAAGDPYVVEADVIVAPEPNGLEATANGLLVAPSADAGNQLTMGADGRLFVPPDAPLETECGLTGDGTAAAPLAASVVAWPYTDCDVDSYAGGVYCDSTGALRSEPRATATSVEQPIEMTYPDLPVPTGSTTVVENRPFSVTNPDPCRPAFVLYEAELDVDFTLPPNSAAAYAIAGDDMWRVENKSTQQVNDIHVQTTKVYARVIPPGATVAEPFPIALGRNYNNNATYSRIQTFHRAFIFNL
ncbi:hypothetical protein [Streptomyces sp. NPDC003393]